MKKYLSLKTVYGLAVVVLMTSCVAKKKYTEAQNTITQLQTENAQLKETGTTMQQNIATLESERTTLKTRLDSTNTWVSGQQTRWNSFQAFYDEGMKTTEQVHQQLHSQLDDLIGSENITTANGRITVNLTEKTLFTSGSSRLSTKGADILAQLAQVVKENPNVEIDIASTPGYYTDMASGSTPTSDVTMANDQTTNPPAQKDDAKMKTDDDGDVKYKDDKTKIKADADGDVKVKTATTKTKTSGTYAKKSATKSYAAKSTARKSESKSRTYSSSPSKKSTTSASATWSLNMARSSAIAKKLVDEGVAKSRILVNNQTSTGTTPANKDFQIIISPKADTYYKAIGNPSMNK
ncbi:MAG TPA: hypothetical protein VGD17_02870 [Chitinophagaceae bacterium]